MGGVVAIIPARGGSKGIPNKNILKINDKPLIAWSIEHALSSKSIDSVWVSSDSEEIISIAKKYGANSIIRPDSISGDEASSESAWLHALDIIEKHMEVSLIVGMQATSPVRGPTDLDDAIQAFNDQKLDSLISVTEIRDHNVWTMTEKGPEPVNYDFMNRKRRQDTDVRYLENGSFYLFKPKILRTTNNRIGGKIGFYHQELYKMFQIDDHEDLTLCKAIINGYFPQKI